MTALEIEECPQQAEDCPRCNGTNTHYDDPIPSMLGHGEETSLHCRDCNESFSANPFTGVYFVPRKKGEPK
jgi:hypothetical protein